MIDGPKLAEGKAYWALGGMTISEDNQWMAYGVDEVSRRVYQIQFENLNDPLFHSEVLEGTSGRATWAADNKTVFYTKKDPQTLRDFQIWRHIVGTPQAEDVLVFQEDDEEFSCYVFKTKSEAYIIIGSSQTLIKEYRYIKANEPLSEFKVFLERQDDHEYGIDHYGDHFFITTNWEAKNFRLMKCPVEDTRQSQWQEVLPHREEVLLEGVEIFRDYMVVDERINGLTCLRIMRWDNTVDYYLPFADAAYAAGVGANPDFNTEILRYGYSSMVTPASTFDFNMRTQESCLLKQQEVVGGYDRNQYYCERVMVTARDGVQVPMSIVYRKDFKKNGEQPVLLYAYGSYGHSIDAGFSSGRLSLLDRGFAFAIAHIRGGKRWEDNGMKMGSC